MRQRSSRPGWRHRAAAASSLLWLGWTCAAPASAQEPQPLTAAVLPFAHRGDDPELVPLAAAMADMLATDLAQTPELRLVERERLRDLRAEWKLGASGAVDRASAAAAGRLLGADVLVLGAITALRPALRLDARVVATRTGEILCAAQAEGSTDTFFQVEQRLATRLLEALGARLSPMVRLRIGKGAPQRIDAAVAYGRGLLASDRGDKAAAKAAFGAALAADPDFAAARRRLSALETKVAELEARTQAVERAGGRVLRPVTLLDHWHNANVARGRGDEALARADVRELLKRAPLALDALTLWITLGGAPAALPAPARSVATALKAIARGDTAAALVATRPFSGKAEGSDARAMALVRQQALALAEPSRQPAEERQERAALALLLPEPDVDAGVTVSAAGIEPWARMWLAERTWAQAALAAGVTRAELLQRPIAVAAPERQGRSAPWLRLDVRLGEATTQDVQCTIRAQGATRLVAMQRTIPSAWDGEATLWTADLPDPPPGPRWNVQVVRVDARGQRRETTMELPAPTVWGGNWRALGHGIGRVTTDRYPMAGVQLAALHGAASERWRVLVDAAAGVWLTVSPDPDRGLAWQPLWASRPGAAANGLAVVWDLPARAAHGLGLRLPLVVLRADGAPLSLGTLELGRLWAADGTWTFHSAARAGAMDGPLDGAAAPWHIDVTVAALLSAGETALAARAFREGAAGLDRLGRALWLLDGPPRRAAASLAVAKAWPVEDGWDGLLPADAVTATQDGAAAPTTPAAPTTAAAWQRWLAAHRASRGAPPRMVPLATGGRWMVDAVTVQDYLRCVEHGSCAPLLDDVCRDDGPVGHGQQPAHCGTFSPNLYPATTIRLHDARSYCTFVGGRLPTESEFLEAATAEARLPGAHGGNRGDDILCALHDIGRQGPAPCAGRRGEAAVDWDGDAWLAPAGRPNASLAANVRSWLDGEAPRVAGCSYTDAVDAAACRTRVSAHVAWASADVGARCVLPHIGGARAPPTPPARSAPALVWRAVPAGPTVIGAGGPRPALVPGDDASADIVAEDLAGVSAGDVRRLGHRLAALDLRDPMPAIAIEELLGRARWRGWTPSHALERLAAAAGDPGQGALEPLGLRVSTSWLERRARQQEPDPAKLAQAVRRLAWAELRRELDRGDGETPKPDDAAVWRSERGQRCDDRAPATCEDATATASNRLTARPRAPWRVTVAGFEMLETEVTQQQYHAVTGRNPALVPCAQCAVERVSWREAEAFCAAVGGALPTEAQWSRALRGESDRWRPANLDGVARYRGNSRLQAAPVGSKAAAPFGHRDLLGSVWEWLRDGYRDPWAWDALHKPRLRSVARDPGQASGPAGQCLTDPRGLRALEARLAKLPWQAHGRHGEIACFASDEDAKAALAALAGHDPVTPPADDDRDRGERVIVGGSYGADERLVHAAARAGQREQARSPYVGFRCVRQSRGR